MSKYTITLKEEGVGEPASITIQYDERDDLVDALGSFATLLRLCSFKVLTQTLSKAIGEQLQVPPARCTCHERDSSYVCDYCRSQGHRGHMQ